MYLTLTLTLTYLGANLRQSSRPKIYLRPNRPTANRRITSTDLVAYLRWPVSIPRYGGPHPQPCAEIQEALVHGRSPAHVREAPQLCGRHLYCVGVGMSPICSKGCLFFFPAILLILAYFSCLACLFFSFYASRINVLRHSSMAATRAFYNGIH